MNLSHQLPAVLAGDIHANCLLNPAGDLLGAGFQHGEVVRAVLVLPLPPLVAAKQDGRHPSLYALVHRPSLQATKGHIGGKNLFYFDFRSRGRGWGYQNDTSKIEPESFITVNFTSRMDYTLKKF